jgi:hypothetical protein
MVFLAPDMRDIRPAKPSSPRRFLWSLILLLQLPTYDHS